MAKKLSDHLLNSLEELVPYDFEKFKFKLQNTSLEKEHPRIPRGLLQMARPVKLATLLVNSYGEEDAVRLTLQVLRGINQRLLAEELYKATGQDYPTQEGGTDSSAVLCSSGENKPKSLKIPDGPDGDRQQQSGEGIASQQSGQPEAGRGSQKKSQDRRRDQGPDGQGKPGVRSMTPPSRRGPFLSPARLAGEKGCIPSSRLHRNAHSTSRLQGLSSNSFCGSLTPLPKEQLLHSLSPEPPPPCERHMKQPLLLFCEDHRELVCLICSLSQEHRGHQVRPIEEVALEFKEQIHWQLEHLKELRKSGEEQKYQGDKETANFLKQTEAQKQKVRHQMQQLCQFLEKQEQLFVAWLEELGQTIGQVREKYSSRVSQDIAFLDELIGEMEAKQCQPAWGLVQDIEVTLHRAKTVTIPEPWATPPEVKEKIHLFYHKSEFVEKSMKRFSESLRSEVEMLMGEHGGRSGADQGSQKSGRVHVSWRWGEPVGMLPMDPQLGIVTSSAVNVILDAETTHPNLVFSDDLKSVRLGNKWDQLPKGPEWFSSCIQVMGSPTFLSGRQYWEVEVGGKTDWVLGVCKASMSRKGSVALSPENGYWVVMMTMHNEYQASAFPPTRLWLKKPPWRVGIFLEYEAGDISFYNMTAKSHIYTFTCCSSSGPLQPVFSPGTHDGRKNTDPLIIGPVCVQGPH
ncbi:pyrin [Dugong dugon]